MVGAMQRGIFNQMGPKTDQFDSAVSSLAERPAETVTDLDLNTQLFGYFTSNCSPRSFIVLNLPTGELPVSSVRLSFASTTD